MLPQTRWRNRRNPSNPDFDRPGNRALRQRQSGHRSGDNIRFGMDEAGLRQLTIPTYIIVGARDTQAPAKENSEFAAKFIPHVQLDVLPGLVDHEIFVNECDALGRDTWPEACIDAPGIDRTKLHEYIGSAALKFFDSNLGVKRKSSK